MPDRNLSEKMEILKEKGVVLTTPRLLILDFLLKNQIHPTAEDIYKALKKDFPTISQASIYNTLKLFVKLHIVSELFIEKDKARYDINTKPHAHFKCLQCGKVYDLFDIPLKDMASHVKGHQVITFQTYFYGICKECLKTKRN